MSTLFVTATGTDVGKTFVTTRLIAELRAARRSVQALKPVASGFDAADVSASDTGVLLDALGLPATPANLDAVSPWRFAAPLSPDMAAAREGRSIGFDDLVALCRNALAGAPENFFIEGVGGIMVPLDGAHTVLDWARALGLPLIVVTGSYLGSISHTLTTLKVAADAGLAVAALVVNETGDGAVPLDETVATMKRFAPGIPVATIARVKAPVGARADFAALARLLALDRA